MGGLAWLIDIFNPKIAVFRAANVSLNEVRTYLPLSAVSVSVLVTAI